MRNGFVSNSSSSSFVLLIPERMTTEEFIADIRKTIDKYNSQYNEFTSTQTTKLINDLRKKKFACQYEDKERRICQLISGLHYAEKYLEKGEEKPLEKYVVSMIQTGPDDGFVQMADENQIKKLLGEQK